jgi:hypothetical protein
MWVVVTIVLVFIFVILWGSFEWRKMIPEDRERAKKIIEEYDKAKRGGDKTESNDSLASVTLKISVDKPDFIPLEDRIKAAHISPHGLYPHEIIALELSKKYNNRTTINEIQGFWVYSYDVPRDTVMPLYKSLMERGFVEVGMLEDALNAENATALKEELKKRGLKVSGRKNDLIKRLLSEADYESLSKSFPKRPYVPTELGRKAIEDEKYLDYQWIGLDIWALNKLVYSPPNIPRKDKIYNYVLNRSKEVIDSKYIHSYGEHQNNLYRLLREDGRDKEAANAFANVVFCELNWRGEEIRELEEYEIDRDSLDLPFIMRLTGEILKTKIALNLDDNEYKLFLLERFASIDAPRVFTDAESANIIIMELSGDDRGLQELYASAKSRLKRKFSHLKEINLPYELTGYRNN